MKRSERNGHRSDNVIIACSGLTLNATQWARKLGMTTAKVCQRFHAGWPAKAILAPFNRREATKEQRARQVSFAGFNLTMAQWADKLGMPYKRLQKRLLRGWAIQEALTPFDRLGKKVKKPRGGSDHALRASHHTRGECNGSDETIST